MEMVLEGDFVPVKELTSEMDFVSLSVATYVGVSVSCLVVEGLMVWLLVDETE